ncbi:hypothetical protein VNI00_001147 [Paramarasmius palmivorus]|uniref:lytic cellulose monooxygenase (C4-dehydrogenating) n=1 Tax=Paramarasmius palmivorus TaxID=297713 RepID=A0AAW0E912_9AGAR
MRPFILVATLSSVSSVLGHGYVQQLKIGSEYVQAWNPYKDPQQHATRITRPFKDNGPIPDKFSILFFQFTTAAITCNVGKTADTQNTPVNATAAVPAGTTIGFLWTDWQSDHPGPSRPRTPIGSF